MHKESASVTQDQLLSNPSGPLSPARSETIRFEPDGDMHGAIGQARQVLELEAQAVSSLIGNLDESFEEAIQLLYDCQGKVIVSGIGKSGHIARKIAATFASTGTPAFFVHIAELKHGDLGMIDEKDLVIILSGSGETAEIISVLDPLKRLGVKLISLTGDPQSTLAAVSNVVLNVFVEREACPHNLAPTTSTTACLAMGDALAIVLMKKKRFGVEDYARSHPGGSLGRKLITVNDVMRKGIAIPIVRKDTGYGALLREINEKKLGFATVCDHEGRLIGVVTDGDLRRSLINHGSQAFDLQAERVMTKGPKTISPSNLAVEALKVMERFAISALMIVDQEERPIGLIDLKDLLRAGVF
jgi:arabinose-5-phosphate isomerase